MTQFPSVLWAISRIPSSQERGGVFSLPLKIVTKLFASSASTQRQFSKGSFLGARMRVLDCREYMGAFFETFVRPDFSFEAGSQTPVILDCGRNIGLSVLSFKLLYPESRIMAFEPDRFTFDVLQANVKGNQLRGVELHDQATYATDGVTNFYTDPGHAVSLVMSTKRERFPGRTVAWQEVETGQLSPFVNRKVEIIKIVIKGAEGTLMNELAQAGILRCIKETFC